MLVKELSLYYDLFGIFYLYTNHEPISKQDCVGKQLAMKEMRVILGYLLLNYKFSIEDKYMNMELIPSEGGRRMSSVCKPTPEIPLIVKAINSRI